MDETVLDQIVRNVQTRRYGKYRGFVTDNDDPDRRGRLQLTVPAVFGDRTTTWALPCLPFGGRSGQGFFVVPEIDAQVWVEFEAGDTSMPIWTGTFWQASGDAPSEVQSPPTTRIFKTRKGHSLHFEDKDDEERVCLKHTTGASVDIDANGTVAVTDANGAKVTLDAANNRLRVEDANGNVLSMTDTGTSIEDANGNTIEMAASGITVKGQQVVVQGTQVMLGGTGGEPVIKGTSFLTLFATHVHPTAWGPSGPPIPQGEASALSTTVMTK